MPKVIHIRNVPDEVYDKLEARAVKLGLTLSDYLLFQIKLLAGSEEIEDKLTLQEWLEDVSKFPPTYPSEDAATIIRRHRDGGDAD